MKTYRRSYENPYHPRTTSAIDAVFDRARETVRELEARRVEPVDRDWSPAQVCRRAS